MASDRMEFKSSLVRLLPRLLPETSKCSQPASWHRKASGVRESAGMSCAVRIHKRVSAGRPSREGGTSLARHWARDWLALARTQVHHETETRNAICLAFLNACDSAVAPLDDLAQLA